MPKLKKTRKQKMKTDQRRQVSTSMASPSKSVEKAAPERAQQAPERRDGTYSLSDSFAVKTKASTKQTLQKETTVDTNEYKYLRGDLWKTLFLTSAIVVTELVIRFAVERG